MDPLTVGFLGICRQARSSHQKTHSQEPGTEVVLFGGVDAKELLSKTHLSGVHWKTCSKLLPLFHHSSVLNCAFIILYQVLVLEHIAPEVQCDPNRENLKAH